MTDLKDGVPPLTYEDMDLNLIKEAITNCFYGKVNKRRATRTPSVTKEGEWYKIDTGVSIVYTKEGGYKLFCEALMERGFKLPNLDK